MGFGWMLDAVMVIVLLVCAVTDLKVRLIYNKVVFPGLVFALILQTVSSGFSGMLDALAGFAVGLGLLFIPYLTGGMGAGDVKLLALVGAFKGVMFVLTAGIYMALIGGGMSLVVMVIRRGFLRKMQWTAYYLAGIRSGIALPLDLRGMFTSTGTPYGVAIAGGALYALFFNGIE